jgi:hypothetical protein
MFRFVLREKMLHVFPSINRKISINKTIFRVWRLVPQCKERNTWRNREVSGYWRGLHNMALFTNTVLVKIMLTLMPSVDRLCGLVVRVLGYRSGGPGSIPGTTRKESSGSGTGSIQPREYNWGATWKKSSGSYLENREYGCRDPSRWQRGTIRKSWQSLRRQATVARSV